MQGPLTKTIKKRLALWVAVLLALVALPLPAPARADTAMVRVLLSTQGASELAVTVSGTYRLAETDDTFTGGKLTLSASGSRVTVTHSSLGALYTGANVTVERETLGRTGGTLTLRAGGYNRSYLGHLSVTAEDGELVVVNRVPLSHYLYGVVAHEMSNSFPIEALKAQAIAAKNYVLPRLGRSGAYDIGDTSTDQVYKGYNSANRNVIEAVDATMNDVLLLGGAVMPCYYSASNGGYMIKPSENWSSTAYDAGYSEGFDDYDMKNPASPRETLFIPTAFTERNVGNATLYALVMDALAAALEQPDAIPAGYVYDSLVRISNVVSTDAAGSMAGLDHENAVFTAVVKVVAGEAGAEPAVTPTPEPAETPTPTPSATEEVFPVVTPRLSVTAQRFVAGSGEQPEPVTEPSEPTPTPDGAQRQDQEPTQEPEQEPTPEPTPAPTPSLANVLGADAEVPVTFMIPFQQMAEAGLFENTSLRIYYASPTADGFTLTHARYGHGVGMSQRGAQQMANEGKTYREILAYYYAGATLSGYAYTLPEDLPETGGGDDQAPATAIGTARVSGSAVNLRRSASSASTSLGKLANNTILTVSGLSGEWYAVRVDATGQTGYIHSDYVVMTSETVLAAGYVNASAVNLRKGSSTGTASLGKLDRNTAVSIYAMVDGWYRVRVDATGQEGYIIKNYVTVRTAAAKPPAATAAPATATPKPTATPEIPLPVTTATAKPMATAKPTATPATGGTTVKPAATPKPTATPATGGTTAKPTATPEIPLPVTTATAKPTATGKPTATPAPTESVFTAYGQINATQVNFRTGPSTSTTSLGKLDRPEALGIYEKVGSWYRVRVLSLGKDAYVYARYVTLTASGTGDGETIGSGEINATGVNIRTGPSTGYTSLGKLGKRTQLTILGSEGSWYRVRVEDTGLEGFVFGKYVTLVSTGTGAGASLPAVTGQGTINTGLLNLRDKPGTGSDSTVLLSMRYGYTVTVHSITGTWAYVTYNGVTGYCIAKCIDMN